MAVLGNPTHLLTVEFPDVPGCWSSCRWSFYSTLRISVAIYSGVLQHEQRNVCVFTGLKAYLCSTLEPKLFLLSPLRARSGRCSQSTPSHLNRLVQNTCLWLLSLTKQRSHILVIQLLCVSIVRQPTMIWEGRNVVFALTMVSLFCPTITVRERALSQELEEAGIPFHSFR